MGTNKALLRFDDGTAVIERIVARVSPLVSEVLVVTNTPASYEFLGLPMVGDEIPGTSSLGGIYTGVLRAACDRVLVLSCDLPRLSSAFLLHLLSLPLDYEVLIPFVDGRQQPLQAVYTKAALPAMRSLIAEGDLKIVRLLELCVGRRLEVEGEWAESFTNMNTPEDWERIRRGGA